MGKGAALKLALPEACASGPSAAPGCQARTGCTSEDDFAQEFDFDRLDYDCWSQDVLDDPFLEANGCEELYDIPISSQLPLRDVAQHGTPKTTASDVPPFGSLAVDALFQPNVMAAATVSTSSNSPPPMSAKPATVETTKPTALPPSTLLPPQGICANKSPHWLPPVRDQRPVSPLLLQGGPIDATSPPAGSPPQPLLNPTTHHDLAAQNIFSDILGCKPEAEWQQQQQQEQQQQEQQQQQPLPLPVTVTPAATLRVKNRCEIATAFAAPPVDEVVLYCSQASKRKAETDVEAEESDKGSTCDSTSDASHGMTVDHFRENVVAPCLLTAEEVEEFLPSIPTQQETADGFVVYILPTLWRSHYAPDRVHVSLGLNMMRALSAEAPATYYGSINPRIVTTGISKRPPRGSLSNHSEAAVPAQTRASRKSKAHSCKTAASERRESTLHPPATVPSPQDPELLEVWLLRRSLKAASAGEVIGSHHLKDRQCSSTITGRHAPLWARGEWAVDIIAKVAACTGETFWLKATNRAVLEAAADGT